MPAAEARPRAGDRVTVLHLCQPRTADQRDRSQGHLQAGPFRGGLPCDENRTARLDEESRLHDPDQLRRQRHADTTRSVTGPGEDNPEDFQGGS